MRLLLFSLLLVTSPGILFANQAKTTIEERMVPLGHGISGEEIYVNSLEISPDFKHIGYVSRIGGTFRVWLDGVSKKSHSGVTRQSPFFSPEQNRLAYIANEGDNMFVVIDNHEHDRYKQVGTLTFSPDGSRVAYRAEDAKGSQFVVINGKEGPKFDVGITNDIGIVFSPDSKHVAYVGINDKDSVIFVKDNKKIDSFKQIKQVKFSPDSNHLAYSAMKDDGWVVVLDNKSGQTYIMVDNLMFSPDSTQLVYMAQKSRRSIIVINNKEISEGIGVLFPSFSPHKGRFAYIIAEKNNKFCYVLDGEKELLVDKPGRMIFSHDDTSAAYAALIKDKWHVLKDGVKGPAFKKIYAFSYSPASNDILYAAENEAGQKCVVVNHIPEKFYNSIGAPVYSKNGQKYAYVATNNDGKMFIIINGQEQKTTYPIIGIPVEEVNESGVSAQHPYFSDTGKRLAFPVYDPDQKKAFMVVDGKNQQTFDAVMAPCFSPDEKHIAYMGKKGNSWHMVVNGKPGRHTCDGMIRGATIAFDPANNCFFILVASNTESGLSFYRMEAEIKSP